MVFEEPKVEFVTIESEDILASTGAGYNICEKHGVTGPGDKDTICIFMQWEMSEETFLCWQNDQDNGEFTYKP